MITTTTVTGTIARIQDCGSIITLWLRTKRGQESPVHFDHRMFQHLLEGENCTSDELVGRRASLTDETLTFKD